MAVAAAVRQDALMKGGLPADAITQLRAAVAQYQAAIDTRGQSVAERHGATAGVDAQLTRARRLVDTMSVLVTRAIRSDPVALAEWKQLKRVTLKGVPKPVEGSTTGTAAEAPTSTTTPPAAPASAIELKVA